MNLQRDIFIEEVRKKMEKDKTIYFLSADFGAMALDRLRKEFPKNFIHCGISEQAMLDMATGLALNGNKVIVYAMSPFLSLRALEQIKCGPGLMKLPIIILSVGIGLGYADSGPTHYSNEDLACLRTIIGNSIFTLSSNQQCKVVAKELLSKPQFSYVRLDRDLTDLKTKSFKLSDFKKGYILHGKASKDKILIISHGSTSNLAFQTYRKYDSRYYFIDLFRSKPFPKRISEHLKNNKGIIVIDEQNINGGLASCVFEFLTHQKYHKKIKSINLPEKYIYENGGKEFLLKTFNFTEKNILKVSKSFN